MSIMQDDTFGEVEFEQLEVDEDGNVKFSRRDLTPYVEFVKTQLVPKPVGTAAKLVVMTGEIKRNGKQYVGRGKSELADAKSFQEAANSMGYGLKVSARHLTDGKTLLRMTLTKKRQFTDEQNANRERGQNKRRLQLAQDRQTKATAALRADANDESAKATLAEATARIAELEKALAPAKPPAKK